MHAVEQIDYPGLIGEMAEAGMKGMPDVLFGKLGELGQPKTRNEVRYFWAALFNAARTNDPVWVWLCRAPHIRNFAPPEAEAHVMPVFMSNIPLPVIGGPDDAPYQPSEQPKQWPVEPTEENFREQVEVLDAYLRAEGEKNPDNFCKTIRDYVASFYHSGTGQMMTQIQLTEAGFHALATREGLDWLMKMYPA